MQALPRDIGGLRPNEQYLSQIAAALDNFGDAAGFQSNLASTVFTVTETSHFVLEKGEYALGLFTGGTYTAASMTTKAGLSMIARRVAKNYVVDELAAAALTPVMGQAMATAQEAGVNPTMLRAGMLSLQATGALKAAKPRLTTGPHAFSGQLPSRLLTGQRLGLPGDPKVLRRNMTAAGVDAPESGAAHHIVAHGSTNINAAAARGVLQRQGIDINEASDGVFMPIDGKRAVPGVETHSSVHTNTYYENVAQRLTAAEAGGRESVLNALYDIRQELLNGTFPVR